MVVPKKGASVPSTTCDLSLASSTAATGGTAMPPPRRQHAQIRHDERHRAPGLILQAHCAVALVDILLSTVNHDR